MGEFCMGIILTLFTFMVFLIGQTQANEEIKTECLRQHSFYIGKYTFDCEVKSVTQ